MLRPPKNLTELPERKYDWRTAGIPLTVHEAIAALWRGNGNITTAAELLCIPASEFRDIVHRIPAIKEQWLEIQEQQLDQAERNLWNQLNSRMGGNRKDGTAQWVLQRAGREYTPRNAGVPGGNLKLVWVNPNLEP